MPPLKIKNIDALKDLVGREFAVTDWLTITQDRIQQFAEATEDRQWIHLESSRAQRESPYGATIAHGFLTLSLLSHLLHEALEIKNGVRLAVNYGLNRVRFPSPVSVNSKIRGRFTLQSLVEVGEAHQAVFSVVVEDDNQGKPCCVAEWVVRYCP
jgi:acyl dehydratase